MHAPNPTQDQLNSMRDDLVAMHKKHDEITKSPTATFTEKQAALLQLEHMQTQFKEKLAVSGIKYLTEQIEIAKTMDAIGAAYAAQDALAAEHMKEYMDSYQRSISTNPSISPSTTTIRHTGRPGRPSSTLTPGQKAQQAAAALGIKSAENLAILSIAVLAYIQSDEQNSRKDIVSKQATKMGEIYIQEKEEARIAAQRAQERQKAEMERAIQAERERAAAIEHAIQAERIAEEEKAAQARMRAEEEEAREQQIVERIEAELAKAKAEYLKEITLLKTALANKETEAAIQAERARAAAPTQIKETTSPQDFITHCCGQILQYNPTTSQVQITGDNNHTYTISDIKLLDALCKWNDREYPHQQPIATLCIDGNGIKLYNLGTSLPYPSSHPSDPDTLHCANGYKPLSDYKITKITDNSLTLTRTGYYTQKPASISATISYTLV